jgi:HlyD family secretion protein
MIKMSPEQLTPVQAVVKPAPRADFGRAEKSVRRGSRWLRIVLVILGLAVAGALGAYLLASGKGHGAKQDAGRKHAGGSSESGGGEPTVQVVKPVRGGMVRTTNQPGTIRASEFAELFAKVSGFVKTLNVDRGSRVKKGDVLAEIYDPERDVAVEQSAAALEHANAMVAQAESNILTAQAAVLAAKAQQNEAKSVREQRVAERNYRKKQYIRINELVKKGDVEERLADEEYDNYLSAEGAVHSAEAGIETAAAQFAEATAKVQLAKADLKSAQAGVHVSKANLDMAKVFVQYTKILSPYDGVVIFRGESVHLGTFIRSASEGTSVPLFTVAADNKMRTIVLVPDRDVPYCKVGDPATVQLDALAGRVFKAKVSRTAESEDLKDRTMRVEIDIDNADHALRDGMFGRAEILLEKLIKSLTIPSSCLAQRNGKGEGAVYIVKDGELHRVPVRVGLDNGLRVEVISGLNENDQVVLRPDASVAEGTRVQTEAVNAPSAKESPAGHA